MAPASEWAIRSHGVLSRKVSHRRISPLFMPCLNQCTRCAELPCVRDCDTTWPRDCRCRRSSLICAAAFSACSISPGSMMFLTVSARFPQTPAGQSASNRKTAQDAAGCKCVHVPVKPVHRPIPYCPVLWRRSVPRHRWRTAVTPAQALASPRQR